MNKITLLKIMLMLALFIAAITVHAQVTTSPDTVCAGATAQKYWISKTVGSTYFWSCTANGTQNALTSNDTAYFDWASTTGIDTLKVVERNSNGCYGDTIRLAVFRYRPTVAIAGTDSICSGSATTSAPISVAFYGVAPFNFTYTNGTTTQSVTTSSNPYTFNTGVLTTGPKTYSITAYTDRYSCPSVTGTGAAVITVFPRPSTSVISHF